MSLIKPDTLLCSSMTFVMKNHNFSLIEAPANSALVWTAGSVNKSEVRWGSENRWTAVDSAAHYQAVGELLLISQSRSRAGLHSLHFGVYREVLSMRTEPVSAPSEGLVDELKGRVSREQRGFTEFWIDHLSLGTSFPSRNSPSEIWICWYSKLLVY